MTTTVRRSLLVSGLLICLAGSLMAAPVAMVDRSFASAKFHV